MSNCNPQSTTWPRVPNDLLEVEAESLLQHPVIQVVMQSVGGFLLILNESRQILAMNQEVLHALGIYEGDPLLGLRPGDALSCVNALEAPGGCHTGEGCKHCGAFLTLLQAEKSQASAIGECHLLRKTAHRLEPAMFKLRVTPLTLSSHKLFIVVLQDISAQRKRLELERLFYHDLQNTLQALHGWSELLQHPSSDGKRVAQQILDISQRLTDEVAQQRMLNHAEQGTLRINPTQVFLPDLFNKLRSHFHAPGDVHHTLLHLEPPPAATLHTDATLLLRVLVNMVKNALEATPPGGRVDVRATVSPQETRIQVSNPGHLDPEVAQSLFHRTFSSKGEPGRGYGTYSMKLLGETYLRGKVGFSQDPILHEITFHIVLPNSAHALTG